MTKKTPTKLNATETKSAFAKRLGVSAGRISQLIARGMPVEADGRINIDAATAWTGDNVGRKKADPDPEAGSLAEARTRAALALAKVREHDLAQRRGLYMLRIEANSAIRVHRTILNQELNRFPDIYSEIIAARLGVDEATVNDALNEVLELFYEHLRAVAPPPSIKEFLQLAAVHIHGDEELDCDDDDE